MAYKYGIDSYQLAAAQVITAQELAEIDFHICRIGTRGYGGMGTAAWYTRSFSVDDYCRANIQATQAAGKYMGVYVFSYAWDATSAEREADDVCDLLDSWGVSLELPIFLDWEKTGTPIGSYEMFQTQIGHTITTSELENIFIAFHARCRQRNRSAGMYFSATFYGNLLPAAWVEAQRANGNYFWLASWVLYPSTPPQPCDVWQYAGDKYYIGNVTTNYKVDQNYLINENMVNARGKIPIWLLLKMKGDDKRNGHTILL